MTLRTRGLIAASRLICRLPEAPLVGVANLLGDAWYRVAPARAARARRNLARVCRALDDTGRGSPAVRTAANDPRALERLVRAAFRHGAQYYLEVARTPAISPRDVDARMVIETKFPSLDAMEQLVAMGMQEGMLAALGQIDGLLQAENAPR